MWRRARISRPLPLPSPPTISPSSVFLKLQQNHFLRSCLSLRACLPNSNLLINLLSISHAFRAVSNLLIDLFSNSTVHRVATQVSYSPVVPMIYETPENKEKKTTKKTMSSRYGEIGYSRCPADNPPRGGDLDSFELNDLHWSLARLAMTVTTVSKVVEVHVPTSSTPWVSRPSYVILCREGVQYWESTRLRCTRCTSTWLTCKYSVRLFF